MPASDTIVALSTPAGESAIAVIRLSGPACPKLSAELLGRSQELSSRVAHLGKYTDINHSVIDDCLFTYFEHGKSFTG